MYYVRHFLIIRDLVFFQRLLLIFFLTNPLLLPWPAAGSSAGPLLRYTSSFLFFFCCLSDGMNLKWNGNHGNYGNKQTRTSIRLGIWEKFHGYGWKKGQRHQYHTHPVMIATLNCCYYYYSLRRAKSVGKGGNQVWGPRAWEIGTEEMDGMRRDWNRHRAGLQYCSRGLLRKKENLAQAGKAGREREGSGLFSFFLVFLCSVFFFLCI